MASSSLMCRHCIKNEQGIYDIVMFGSYGKIILANDLKIKLSYSQINLQDEQGNPYTAKKSQRFNIVLTCNDPSNLPIIYFKNGNTINTVVSITSTGENILYQGLLNDDCTNIYIDYAQGIDRTKPHYIYFKEISSAKSAASYSTEADAVADSLIQRLAVIKGELWYNMLYGLPLTDKIKSRGIYDAEICQIIYEPINRINYIVDIPKFESYTKDFDNPNLKNQKYFSFNFVATTKYNKDINISN